MKMFVICCAVVFALVVSSRVSAQSYDFQVDYYGEGVASLVPGSDDPSSLSLVPGDTFTWTIMANGGAYWLVEEAGDFFTLMAFAVSEPGTRTGDFTITLSYLGTDVYWESLTGVETQEVHVGTNEITLVQGLAFDRMRLDFELISAVELESLAADPMDLQPIPTTLNGILPIFGAPESNRFSPGIVYVVPEPSSLMLLSLALGMGLGRRRR